MSELKKHSGERSQTNVTMISVIAQEEGGVECLRSVESIPAGVEVTISYRSMITMKIT